jgi:UDP-arabinose 4-epimerase
MSVILVTGGAGFIGSSTCAALARAGFAPVTLDNLSTGHADSVRWGPLEQCDIRDRQRVEQALAKHKPNAIIHFAASAYVGESVGSPQKYYDANVSGMLTLLSAANDAGISKIVFSSSCATYGTPAHIPISEDTPQSPINPYGRTKLVGEWMLRDFSVAYGLRYAALRYFNAAGADVENGLSERHDPETHLIPRVLMAATGRLPRLDVFGDDYNTPDGTCVRDYIHVRDLAEAHVAAVRYLLNGGASVALNLGTGRGSSVREILRAVEQTLKLTVPVNILPRRPGDPAILIADPSRAHRIIDFRPRFSELETILASALQSMSPHS